MEKCDVLNRVAFSFISNFEFQNLNREKQRMLSSNILSVPYTPQLRNSEEKIFNYKHNNFLLKENNFIKLEHNQNNKTTDTL